MKKLLAGKKTLTVNSGGVPSLCNVVIVKNTLLHAAFSAVFHTYDHHLLSLHAFFYKNTLYKNVHDDDDGQTIKNIVRILPS